MNLWIMVGGWIMDGPCSEMLKSNAKELFDEEMDENIKWVSLCAWFWNDKKAFNIFFIKYFGRILERFLIKS